MNVLLLRDSIFDKGVVVFSLKKNMFHQNTLLADHPYKLLLNQNTHDSSGGRLLLTGGGWTSWLQRSFMRDEPLSI